MHQAWVGQGVVRERMPLAAPVPAARRDLEGAVVAQHLALVVPGVAGWHMNL